MKLSETLKVGLFILGLPASADAASTLFRLEGAGASFSNSATAVSTDLAIWSPPWPDAGVTDLTFTVGVATFGNGVDGLESFSTIILPARGDGLDMTRELVGQVINSDDPFGTTYTENGGNFNLFGASPNGTQPFTRAVAAGEGPGERRVLTSFAPATVPEPASQSHRQQRPCPAHAPSSLIRILFPDSVPSSPDLSRGGMVEAVNRELRASLR